MTSRISLCVFSFFVCVTLTSLPSAGAQSLGNSASSTALQTPDVSGKWQVAWQGRLGTEECAIDLHRKSSNKLEGHLQDQRGVSPLSGTIEGKKITFDVQFGGPRPFTTRFTGTVDGDSIEGTSQAINVQGGGAYLGHGGEIVQPEHPWTAKRATSQPVQAAEHGSSSNPNSSGKN
ncbi:MAG: hypothetical protein ABSF97_06270 [Candidatus Sulfotelmatobacter sp.]